MEVFKTIPDLLGKDDILTPKKRYSVYGNQEDGNLQIHKSFDTYQQALDFYTKLRDEGTRDLMIDDNKKKENLANNEL